MTTTIDSTRSIVARDGSELFFAFATADGERGSADIAAVVLLGNKGERDTATLLKGADSLTRQERAEVMQALCDHAKQRRLSTDESHILTSIATLLHDTPPQMVYATLEHIAAGVPRDEREVTLSQALNICDPQGIELSDPFAE